MVPIHGRGPVLCDQTSPATLLRVHMHPSLDQPFHRSPEFSQSCRGPWQTEAASAGISLHSERREGASAAPRYMMTLELPWEADKAGVPHAEGGGSRDGVPMWGTESGDTEASASLTARPWSESRWAVPEDASFRASVRSLQVI